MPDTLAIVAGTAKTFHRQARDRRGVAFDSTTTPFLSTDTLACRVWAGDDTAVLVSPTADWDDANTGSFAVRFSAANTTGLAGIYRYQVVCTRSGSSGIIDDGRIRVTMAPGTATAPLAFTTLDDLLDYFPTLEDVQADASQVGFREEQARATAQMVDALVNLWKWTNLSPTIGQPGFGPMSMFGGTTPPSRWLREQLVPLTPASTIPASLPMRQSTQANLVRPAVSTVLLLYDEVIEVCAKWAIARILKAQIGRSSDQDWWALAARFRRDADGMFMSRRFEIDLSVPQTGYASIIVDGGTTSLR